MKKIIFCLMAIFLSLTFIPLQSFGATTEEPSSLVVTKPPETTESAEAKALTLRLNEISAMDMSKLKSSEKKELRKEVRSIKRELKDISGGVYISAGLLILILILLIILL
jgi:hypothetical protein